MPLHLAQNDMVTLLLIIASLVDYFANSLTGDTIAPGDNGHVPFSLMEFPDCFIAFVSSAGMLHENTTVFCVHSVNYNSIPIRLSSAMWYRVKYILPVTINPLTIRWECAMLVLVRVRKGGRK